MTDTTFDYSSSPVALFAVAARKVPKVVWAYCSACWTRTKHVTKRYESDFIVYTCQTCGQAHRIFAPQKG